MPDSLAPAPRGPREATRGASRRSLAGVPEVAGFELRRCLGRGRHSETWLAHERDFGAEVALKVAAAEGGKVPSFAAEFTMARAFAGLHVVAVHAHGNDGSWGWLAMEVAAGGDLARRLRAPVPPAQALEWIAQAARGLVALHRAGRVHRDLKPANLLLHGDGRLLLADFGLAARVGTPVAPAVQGGIVGTPRYLAPEVLQGGPLEPAADIYALGVLLQQLLTGAPPFAGETLMEVLAQHLVAAPAPLPPHCAAWQGLLDAMLAREPARRLPDAEALLEHMQPALALEWARAQPASGGTRWTT